MGIQPRIGKDARCYARASRRINETMTGEFTMRLNDYKSKVEIPRIMRGERQTIENLMTEEVLLLAKCLGDERESWIPRIAVPESS